MASEGFPTTAETVVAAVDAALQFADATTPAKVADFLDISEDNAEKALRSATNLGLLAEHKAGHFAPASPVARYLSTANQPAKAAILRLVLEQYAPYKCFKHRLAIAVSAAEAANQARSIHAIQAHREDVLHTFISYGTYAQSLVSQGAGMYAVPDATSLDYLGVLADAIASEEEAELQVRKRMGSQAANWVDPNEVLAPLVMAYQKAGSVAADARAPIVYAANAMESFLVQLANASGTNIKGRSGINSKGDALSKAGAITTKHLHMLLYLGHVRNAADHGTDIDPDIGHTWEISLSTAVEYVHVAMSTISAMVSHRNGTFVV